MGGITYLGKRPSRLGTILAWSIPYILLAALFAWMVVSIICAKASGGQMEEWNFLKILMDLTEGHRW
jgi:hypothetical protein